MALRLPWATARVRPYNESLSERLYLICLVTRKSSKYPVVNGAPHFHKALPYWVRIIYLVAFVPPNAITGVVIANSPEVIYTYYESVPHIWGFTAIEDQAWGGAIMWIWSSEMMIQAAVILLGVSYYREKQHKTARERSQQHKRGMLAGAQMRPELKAAGS